MYIANIYVDSSHYDAISQQFTIAIVSVANANISLGLTLTSVANECCCA